MTFDRKDLNMRPLLALTLTVALLAPAASAATPGDLAETVREVPAETEPGTPRVSILQRAHASRALLGEGSVTDAVRAALSLLDVETKLPASSVLPVRAASPDHLDAPVGRLLGAIEVAVPLARSAIRTGTGTALGVLERAAELSREAAGVIAAPNDSTRRARVELRRLIEELGDLVDEPRLHAAALTIARAVDEALPALRAASAARPHAASAAPCDVVEEAPTLCVSDVGDQVHTEDYALSIDLGGNDIYRNHAGAGDGGGTGQDAGVLIDLAGDDTYKEPDNYDPSKFRAIQGAGFDGGIGALIDVEGDDRYEASTRAQGVGQGGIGILYDGAGSDVYDIVSVRPGMYLDPEGNPTLGSAVAAGQSYAALGLAVLVDRGFADDTYRIEAEATPIEVDGAVFPGRVYAHGQGWASVGAALFSDGGGSDTMSILGTSDPGVDGDLRAVVAGASDVSGMGFASFMGGALHSSGEGHTGRRLVSDVRHGAPTFATGMGTAMTSSFAALLDESGDDTYDASALTRSMRQVTGAAESLDVEANAGGMMRTWLSTQAHARGGSGALLHDQAGDDHYRATVLEEAEVEAHNTRAEPPADPAVPSTRATASSGTVAVDAQAAASGESVALLFDDSGNDVYEVRVTSRARATATGARVAAIAVSGGVQALAQGSSVVRDYSELRDAGTGRDSYVFVSSSEASADPPTIVSSSNDVRSLGWAYTFDFSDARFADLGGIDTFEFDPPLAACVGSRGGDGVWVDCDPLTPGPAGIGVNL